jgi:hypothetical protein
MDIYMDNIRDLFADSKSVPMTSLQVREDANRANYVEGLLEKVQQHPKNADC